MDIDNLLVCPKLDHTSNELSNLYWDARRTNEKTRPSLILFILGRLEVPWEV
jgi:hypothetical protein